MLFHPTKRFVFIATPKTGTTSIEAHLSSIDSAVLRDHLVDPKGHTVRVRKHISAVEVREIMGTQADTFTVVGFVRHPREIIYSKYFFYRQGWPYTKWQSGEMSLFHRNKNWMKPSLAHRVLLARALPIVWWARFYPLKSNCHFLLDASGERAVDQVGRFDTLQSDFVRIFTKFGYDEQELALPRKNVTEYDLTTEDRAAVERIARRRLPCDFALYESIRRAA